jgi:hypothetical protein
MSLQAIYERGVFDDATTDHRRAHVYVRSGELGLAQRADLALMDALTDCDPPQRVHVVGPSGAGKTSLIMRVLGDMARRDGALRHEVLILRIGDRPQNLASPDGVMKMVLDTVAIEGHRFANVDPRVLQDAGADQRVRNPTQIEHRAGLTSPFVNYSASIKEAFTALGFAQNAARLRHDLEDVLETVRAAGYRPVLVLDDTEKFVSPGPDGEVDAALVENLYHHGVRVLGEFHVDLVVAMHPRFEAVKRVAEVIERLAMPRIDVPELPAEEERPALRKILERRMRRDGIDGSLDEVITSAAVEELQLLYHERDQDLRSVLKLAQSAAGNALHRGAAAIEGLDIRTVVARPKR